MLRHSTDNALTTRESSTAAPMMFQQLNDAPSQHRQCSDNPRSSTAAPMMFRWLDDAPSQHRRCSDNPRSSTAALIMFWRPDDASVTYRKLHRSTGNAPFAAPLMLRRLGDASSLWPSRSPLSAIATSNKLAHRVSPSQHQSQRPRPVHNSHSTAPRRMVDARRNGRLTQPWLAAVT